MNVKCKGYSHPFKPDPFFRRHRRPCGFKYLINVTLVNLVLGTGDFRIVTGSSRLSTFGLVSTSSPLAVSCTRVFEWFLSLQLSMIRRSWKQEPQIIAQSTQQTILTLLWSAVCSALLMLMFWSFFLSRRTTNSTGTSSRVEGLSRAGAVIIFSCTTSRCALYITA